MSRERILVFVFHWDISWVLEHLDHCLNIPEPEEKIKFRFPQVSFDGSELFLSICSRIQQKITEKL